MGWISLAESAVSASHYPNGLKPSPTVSVTDTRKVYSCLECLPESWILRQSGTTLRLSPTYSSREWISYTAVSHAKISALQDVESAWEASEAAYIGMCIDSLKNVSPRSSSSKTSRQLEPVALKKWSGHLPSSGMTVDGQLFQPKKLAPATSANDGSYLPTMTAVNYGHNQSNSKNAKRRASLQSMASRGLLPTPMARDWKGSGGANRESPDLSFTMGGALNPQFVEELMGYPSEWTALDASVMPWCQSKREKRLCA
jgi:hypothetical protein